MSLAFLRSAWRGHGLILVGLLVALGVTHVAWVKPREAERRTLREEEQRLNADVAELHAGIQQMDRWKRGDRGEDGVGVRARHVAPAGTMVTSLLDALAGIGAAHGTRMTLIQPIGKPVDEAVTDASGAIVAYQRAELRLRLEARYRDIGEYLADVESMEQLVVVRSVALRQEASVAPRLVADVTLWVYGTP